MEAAMKSVIDENTSVSRAANKYGVPKSTLNNRISGKVCHGDKPSKVVKPYDNVRAKVPQLEEDSESASVKNSDSSEHTSTVARNDKAKEDQMSSQKLPKDKGNMPISRPIINKQ